MKMNKNTLSTILVILATLVIDVIAAKEFLEMHKAEDLYPAAGLTRISMLSEYNSRLKGTNGDTEIFIYDSGKPGGSVLLLGGTHPNEPSAFLSAALILENIRMNQGKMFIVPRACNSGFRCTDPFEGYPQFYHLETMSGMRRFRFGSRISNPLDQWPEPLVYSHYPSGQKLSGFETRNLNRAYPGREKGSFTERIAYGIVELIKKENIDIAFDLHEAAPEIPIINAIVYHEKSEDIGLTAVMNLEMLDLEYAPELSPLRFRGLSHREWGDNTDVLPFLMETSNPIQGRLRGKTNEALIVKGVSPRYKEAKESGKLRIVYEIETGEPLERRVGRHVQAFKEIINAYNEFYPDNMILIDGLPDYTDLMSDGFKKYLK